MHFYVARVTLASGDVLPPITLYADTAVEAELAVSRIPGLRDRDKVAVTVVDNPAVEKWLGRSRSDGRGIVRHTVAWTDEVPGT
ncbi:hypothetical protein [Chthonobacter rhizosphaerae]|uniref:hypothetical protein n=1 Tax=Chthonobacter rhizosphaerae TaxID=2735553 RepID=UPI0015EF3B8B|nr:hypothetical protein [Chthonobacter rhizosphaerae]